MPALVSLSQEDLDALAAEQAANQGSATEPVPPPPAYVATDPGYDLAYPGPVPQPEYIPTTQSAPAAPLPQSPSQAGPVAAPPVPPRYGSVAPVGDAIVTTTHPATGDAPTYRSIPPPGSTYPAREIPTGVPPRDWARLQELYAGGAYPDLEARFPGEGPLGEGKPASPNARQVPFATLDRLVKPYFAGEGNMGARDPLAPVYEDTRTLPGLGGYTLGMGETRPETRWIPGTASMYTEAQTQAMRERAAERGAPFPPEGYVPEMWPGGISSYWYDRAPEPEVLREHGAGYTGERTRDQIAYDNTPVPTPAEWQGEGPTGNYPRDPSPAHLLFDMERRRRERRLRGLFGGRR